ncbi:CNP1-like family protein [Chitinibacter sp. FCG-7]|uniref:CNP1-like family protein n=1 Tax=Chitinibacter mangrovi TaxID=3153927 RepID=A0AAU7F5T0_9NEIS
MTSFAETNVRVERNGRGLPGEVTDWFNDQKAAPAEVGFVLPNIKDLTQWAPLDIPQLKNNSKNSYFLALDSLTLNSDEIVRYVVAIKPAGANITTLFFEGLDCASNQYRHYASASSTGDWRELKNSTWKINSKNGHNAWQGYLADEFCSFNAPWPLETIKKEFVANKWPADCSGCQTR